MDASPSFSRIISGGIQDVSVLLPLLGTEQCEEHVGSALHKGFLYSSITPISIFGSLGITRSAFSILIASLNIQHRFLGAKKLNDGGFIANGVVASIIAVDPHHPKRFLAESRLEMMLADEHIENPEDLTVSWDKGIVQWNLLLVVFTLFIATAGLLPYIYIIHHSQRAPTRLSFLMKLGFPVLRIVGSTLCVILTQFLLQIRILAILKTRLLFMTIDRLVKEIDVDLRVKINPKSRPKKGKERNTRSMWSPHLASERCIWALERWLATELQDVATSKKDNSTVVVINNLYISHYKRHFEQFQKSVPRSITPILCVGLVVGILLTVTGYIGCFYLIQNSSKSTGPLLWLILEILLSIIRFLVWTVNPSWDDSKGIVFELQLASHAPLITCSKYESDITVDGVAPLMRANRFLKDIVSYTGPLSPISLDDVDLFYILTAEGKSLLAHSSTDTHRLPHWKLYVVISAFKERSSRILFKQSNQGNFSIYISALESVRDTTTINVRVNFNEEDITEPKTNFFTADADFMAQISAHYNEIVSRLQMQKLNFGRKAFFNKTWAMQRFPEVWGSENDATQGLGLGSELLTNEDMAYLCQGQMERRREEMYLHLEEWVELYIAFYTQELLQDVPVSLVLKENESVSVVQKYEANEVEYLLIACQTCLEWLLMSTATKWNEFLKIGHDNMVETVIQGSFSDSTTPKGPSKSSKLYSEENLKIKLKNRLAEEWRTLLEKDIRSRKEKMSRRLGAQADSTEKRIQGRRYNDPIGKVIVKTWRDLPSEIHSTSTGTSLANSNNKLLSSAGDRSPSLRSPTPSTSKHSKEDEAAYRDAFRAEMQTRFIEGDKDIRNFADEIFRKNEHRKFELMKSRCYQQVDQLFSRMENQMAEFEELHQKSILVADSHELAKYWHTESLQEQRRLLDRTHNYLVISDTSIQAVGGLPNMVRAIMRSQDFSFIDITESTLFMVKELTAIVRGLKSVTGIASNLGDKVEQEAFDVMQSNIKSAIAAKRDVCFFQDTTASDYYREGYPYLLFRENGRSSCNVFFYVYKKCSHILTLRHCLTTSNAKVDIYLNDRPLERTWGQSQAVKFNFTDEEIPLPEAYLTNIGHPNVLTIVLAIDSKGAYWFSNVFLPVQPVLSCI